MVGSYKTETGVLFVVRKTLSCTCISGPISWPISYYFYESFRCPNTSRFCRIVSKHNEAAYPLTTLTLLKHRFPKLESTKCSVLTVVILEFGSIAWMHSPFQNKTFQVSLSGTVEKKKPCMQQKCINLACKSCTTQNGYLDNNFTATEKFSSCPVLPLALKKISTTFIPDKYVLT